MEEMDPQQLFETLQTDLSDIYEMALNRDDILSEDFSHTLFQEIRELKERYGRKSFINEGGMKKVYKVEDKSTGRYVAMAFLKDNSHKQQERFLREARLTATLEHPNIMPVYDIGITGENEPFFTMKLTSGIGLDEIYKNRTANGTWSLVQRLNLFLGICEGISYSHSRHVVHLDIKPHNILVGEFGEVLISDWGLGKILFDEDEEEESDSIDPAFFNEMTMDGFIKGTPGYMAPEQIDKSLGERDRQTDIYALGGILHFLLTGKAPVTGNNLDEIFEKTLTGTFSTTPEDRKNIPAALAAVINKALSKDKHSRYQTVNVIRNDVEAYMGGFATSAENAGIFKNFLLFVNRHKVLTGSTVLIIAITTTFIIRLKKSERYSRELLSLYEQEQKKIQLIGKEASPHLASIATRNLYAYEYDLCRENAEKAVKRDPENKDAWEIKALCHFYTQEFNSAAKAFEKAPKRKLTNLFKRLAEKYGTSKDDSERLDAETFIQLLQKIPTTSLKRTLYRNEVLNYRSVSEHMKIINAMLYINNPHLSKVNFSFKKIDGKNVLDLSGNPEMDQVGCIRLMPLHSLNVEGLDLIDRETLQMRGMPLEELNIAGTKIKSLSFLESIPNLKKLTISRGMCSAKMLQDLRERMTVIEK